VFQLAEAAVPRAVFAEILRRAAWLRPGPFSKCTRDRSWDLDASARGYRRGGEARVIRAVPPNLPMLAANAVAQAAASPRLPWPASQPMPCRPAAHVRRVDRADTWQHRPVSQHLKATLANGEPRASPQHDRNSAETGCLGAFGLPCAVERTCRREAATGWWWTRSGTAAASRIAADWQRRH
jgi:hypothetical protein